MLGLAKLMEGGRKRSEVLNEVVIAASGLPPYPFDRPPAPEVVEPLKHIVPCEEVVAALEEIEEPVSKPTVHRQVIPKPRWKKP